MSQITEEQFREEASRLADVDPELEAWIKNSDPGTSIDHAFPFSWEVFARLQMWFLEAFNKLCKDRDFKQGMTWHELLNVASSGDDLPA